jgi:hypothetical protein
MMRGLRSAFGFAYVPREQMDWHDHCASNTPRRIAVGSRVLLDCDGLILAP